MEYETIIFEKDEAFVTITLNRPKSLNAINIKMWTELSQALDIVDSDDDIKAFIFAGSPRLDGRPCFCAGGDINRDERVY